MAKARKKLSEEQKNRLKFLTPEFRVSYPHVFKVNSMKGSTPKYSVTMLFDKTEDLVGEDGNGKPVTLKQMIKRAKVAAYGKDESEWPDGIETPLVDGDAPKHAEKEGYAGHWAVKASTNEDSKPDVVDENVEPIEDPKLFYPGCYARASVFASVWDNEFGKGVSFYLDHVQKTKEGKSFGGKKPAKQVFKPINSGRDDEDDDSDSDDDDEDFT